MLIHKQTEGTKDIYGADLFFHTSIENIQWPQIEFVILMNVTALGRKISKPKKKKFQKELYIAQTNKNLDQRPILVVSILGWYYYIFVEGNDVSGVSLCNNNRTSECVNVYLTLVHPGMSSIRVTTVFSRATMSKYTEH